MKAHKLKKLLKISLTLLSFSYLYLETPVFAQGVQGLQPALASNSAADSPIKIHSRAHWRAKTAVPYKKHQPNRITIHHEGGKALSLDQDATQRLRNVQSWCMGPDRQWADIPYHFLIAPDGTVYEGRDPFTAGESNTAYDPTGHLHISFLGNYNEQKLDDKLIQVLTSLIAQLCKEYQISADTIAGHRDYFAQTTCPSEEIYQHIKDGSLQHKVKALLREQ